jgi:hypothetical protein
VPRRLVCLLQEREIDILPVYKTLEAGVNNGELVETSKYVWSYFNNKRCRRRRIEMVYITFQPLNDVILETVARIAIIGKIMSKICSPLIMVGWKYREVLSKKT